MLLLGMICFNLLSLCDVWTVFLPAGKSLTQKIQWAEKHYSDNHIHIYKAVLFDRVKIGWAVDNSIMIQAFEEAYAELIRRE